MIGFQVSVFGGSAWTWVESRQQYYYHAYLKEQPDLNYQNNKIRQEMHVNKFTYMFRLQNDCN